MFPEKLILFRFSAKPHMVKGNLPENKKLVFPKAVLNCEPKPKHS